MALSLDEEQIWCNSNVVFVKDIKKSLKNVSQKEHYAQNQKEAAESSWTFIEVLENLKLTQRRWQESQAKAALLLPEEIGLMRNEVCEAWKSDKKLLWLKMDKIDMIACITKGHGTEEKNVIYKNLFVIQGRIYWEISI